VTTLTSAVETVYTLSQQFAALNLTVPTIALLDNTRCQKCELVQPTEPTSRFELCCSPAYLPNLTLSERFWKVVKKEREVSMGFG
jgi:hypothetical protein